MTWYIDAIDPRGGLAFATRRGAEGDGTRPMEEGSTVFLAAPAFEAELVGSRAIALGSERAGFQIGVFRKDEELPFESIDAVREFVRRAFVGNGPASPPGSEEEGGETGGLGPPGGDDDGERLRLPEGGGPGGLDARYLFMAGWEDFLQRSKKLEPGRSAVVDFWAASRAKAGAGFSGHAFAAVLVQSAWQCVFDVCSAMPESKDDVRWNAWLARARAVVAGLDRLDLWQLLMHAFEKAGHVRLPSGLARAQGWAGQPFASLLWARYLMTVGDRAEVHEFEYWWKQVVYGPGGYFPEEPFRVAGNHAYDDLAAIPCPIATVYHHKEDRIPLSLRGLLLKMLAAPASLRAARSRNLEDTVGLLLFSAAQIVVSTVPQVLSPRVPFSYPFRLPFPERSYSLLAKETWKWIEANLPRRVFDQDVEYLLGARLSAPAAHSAYA